MLISVESDMSLGLPGLCLVGYLSSSVKEAGDRVRTALRNVGYPIPSRKVTVNLSPADIRKDGTGFDVAIATGILISMGIFFIREKFNKELEKTLFLGELGLDGSILPVRGVLPIVDHALKNGIERVVVPEENASEASFIKGLEIIPVGSLTDIIKILSSGEWGDPFVMPEIKKSVQKDFLYDLKDIRGQETMKKGVIIGVAGFHNILLTGAAGSGKSMIAKCIPELMPDLTYNESLELTKIYSIAGNLDLSDGLMKRRPFRAPGQNVSNAALIGGGMSPTPGEVSLANGGVLFLDEFPEYSRSVIEGLRQPMEDHIVNVSRVRASYTFPARFMLVSARNNCPCGFYPNRDKCRCSSGAIQRYKNRISHPIMDRIDIRLEISPVSYDDLFSDNEGMDSKTAKAMIEGARKKQEERFKNESINFNSEIPQSRIEEFIVLGEKEKKLLRNIYDNSGISARGYYKMLRLARTIADIEGREFVSERNIEEAAFFRNEDGATDWR